MNGSVPTELCVRCREHASAEVMDGLPTCHRCADLLRQRGESKRVCPVDGADMRKEVIQNLIVDRCPGCGGVWLDHDELYALLRIAAEHDDDGFMNGVILGLAW